jgi:hypothetical protein
MGKNVNPKSLKGKDKLSRIKNLMGRLETLNESTSLSELDLVKKGPNGVVYGIVRENHKYFIKTTDKSSGNLLAEDFNYIGGLQNKFSEAYDSYAEATKQLNLKFDMLNESFGIEGNNNIFESDGIAFGGGAGFGFVVEEQGCDKCGEKDCVCEDKEVITDEKEDDLDEQQKVLKVDSPAAPAEPAMEEPVEDEVPDEMGMEDPMGDMGMEEPSMEEPMDDEGDDETDPTKKIQKMTGKIGQMMRDMDEPDVDLEKYVINSVISAMHLDLFSEEDVEDIISKLEGEDEEDDMAADEMGGEEELGMEEPAMEEEPAEEEMAEEPAMAEESYKITKGDLVESLTKKILKDRLDESDDYGKLKASPKSVRDRVSKRRTKLKGKSKRKDEGWHLMDEDFDMSSDYVDCPQCEGMGCPHCEGMGYHLSNEFDGGDFGAYDDMEIADDFMTLNADGEYGPFDRDGDEIPADIDLDDDNDGMLDEMDGDGYGVGVMDSVSGSFDRDGDDIPAKIDNVYGDGEDDLDIQFYRGNAPGTKERPGIKEPTTRPGEKERKGPWTKPKVQPKPKAGDTDKPKVRPSFRRKGFFK